MNSAYVILDVCIVIFVFCTLSPISSIPEQILQVNKWYQPLSMGCKHMFSNILIIRKCVCTSFARQTKVINNVSILLM